MATRTASLADDNNTDANFRLWINEIHNALIAYGWLQTSDIGQINFSTVTRPTAISTYQGYAVYQMNDSLQATCAVFLRLDFGTGGGTDTPSLKIQICIGGTNGAGTLTGNVGTQQITTSGSGAGAVTLFNCRSAGTSSSFRCCFWLQNVTNQGFCFAIERDLNTSGVEQATGVNLLCFWASGPSAYTFNSQFLEAAGGTGAVDTKWYAMVSAQTSQSGGGNVGVGPVRTQLGPFRNPMKTMLVFARTDFTGDTTNPVTIYGGSHTYLMIRPAAAVSLNTWNADCCPALLWE